MGSGYRPLEKIASRPDTDIVGVYVRPNPLVENPKKTYPFVNYIEELCQEKELNINQPKKMTPEIIKNITSKEYDFLVSCGYHLLIPEEIINKAKIAAVNIHPGKLPDYRGQSVIEWAMLNGEKEIYMTMHTITNKFDDGDILMEKPVSFKDTDNGNILQGKLYTAAAEILNSFLNNPEQFLTAKRKQETGGNYYHRIKDTDFKIDWNANPDKIKNLTRAMVYPRDGAYGYIDGEKIIIDKATPINLSQSFKNNPGEIIGISDSKIYVASKDKTVFEIPLEAIRNYFNIHDKITLGSLIK